MNDSDQTLEEFEKSIRPKKIVVALVGIGVTLSVLLLISLIMFGLSKAIAIATTG